MKTELIGNNHSLENRETDTLLCHAVMNSLENL